jgi:hypothetical protein
MSSFDILIYIGVIAAISGLSPTLISLFSSLLGSSLGTGHSKTRTWFAIKFFYLGFVSTVSIIGYAFWGLLAACSGKTAEYICLALATLAIAAATIEIKDYFWYGRGVSHKPHKRLKAALHSRTSKKLGLLSSFALGAIAVAATASNIGLLTLNIAGLLFLSTLDKNPFWLVFFGALLLTGVLLTALTVMSGTKISAVMQWKEESKHIMRLGSGLALIATAWLILLITSHSIVVRI